MDTIHNMRPATKTTPWSAVICMMLTSFVLVASEFMPVSLLTPIADDLASTAGQAGQAISISGFFAVITALFSNVLFARFDRRGVILSYTVVLVASGLAVTFAPNYLVFMFGRALIGVSIGGYWSLATAIIARLAAGPDVPKALAMLQGGSALAAVIAAPLGSFLGGLVGWRGAFFVVVPIGIAAFIWQATALPRMPGGRSGSLGRTFGLMGNRTFALGMASMILFFMGQFALSTYLRPFLEDITQLRVNSLSLVLLGIGLAGLAGTSLIPSILRSHMAHVLIGFPAVLVTVALALIGLGPFALATAGLLLLWGLLTTPVPAAWTTWMTRTIPHHLEEGGAWFVALIQFAITSGAFAGGLLFDHVGWWSPFVLSAAAMAGAAAIAVGVTRGLRRQAAISVGHL
ncbi:MFS transporter [Rhizobium phaseoli]|uniref:MFS transporter n=1 Tax=Rhizobium phaseoli TaxID=396 RepID=UPI000BE99EF5|nr:MFS transporter [Rhizobium phaseoli]MDK4729436.1 MFS transporter [Rhizobium phaseoli]NKE91433.1 MFS transporter [Rhizobium phaseoli]PDS69360.1 MFS transporter [Rhizobium phaseoli]